MFAFMIVYWRFWRRVVLVLVLAGNFSSGGNSSAADQDAGGKRRVYVGTYTQGTKSRGIYLFELDLASGTLTPRGLAGRAVNPSFLAISPDRRFLYAVNEAWSGKETGGSVAAFAIDPETGKLTLLNQESSRGQGPCHLSIDRRGGNVLVANYGSGSVAVLPVQKDGRLAPASDFIQHTGHSVDKARQEGPHAHSINLDPTNRRALVADLGLDKIMIYDFDPNIGRLTPHDPPFATVTPGSGPRHLAFHPDGRHAYVINEMHNTVTAFTYNPRQGVLKPFQTVSTLPEKFKGTSYAAEVVVHPSGKFLYGSNRGHDSLAIFSVDPQTGGLTPVGFQTGIKVPRNFVIDSAGDFLLAANQGADSIGVYRIDKDSGQLTAVSKPVPVAAPVCIRLIPMGR